MSFAHHIELFTIRSLPVQTDEMDVMVCWLDDVERIETHLSEVSHDIDAIRNLVNEKEDNLIKAMDCQYRANLYGIQKLPAIVMNKKYVAYGECSLSKALHVLNDREKSNA